MVIIFKRDTSESNEEQPIETWRLSKDLDGIFYPTIRDSNGDWFGLASHKISETGVITPSVVCPYGCGFHEFIKLIGWDLIKEKKQF